MSQSTNRILVDEIIKFSSAMYKQDLRIIISGQSPIIPFCPPYLLIDEDLEEDIYVAMAIIDLQHHRVLCPLWTVMDVLDLFLWKLIQLESAKCPVTVQPGELAVVRWFKDHDQDINWVVRVVNLQNRLGDRCLGATALHR